MKVYTKMCKYLGPAFLVSALTWNAFADGMIAPDIPIPPKETGPIFESSPITLNIPFDTNYTINRTIRLNLVALIRKELRQQGLSDQIEMYNLSSLFITLSGQGQVIFCTLDAPVHERSECRNLISQQNVNYNPNRFGWNTYTLYSSDNNQRLEFPVDIVFAGIMRLHSVSVTIYPKNGIIGGEIPQQPVPPMMPVPPINPLPPQSVAPHFPGKYVTYNYYGEKVIIGSEGRLEKSLKGRNTHLTFQNANYVFANFNWINITALNNAATIDRISVNCFDIRYNDVSFRATDSRNIIIENILLRPNETLTLPVARDCAYIGAVKISGFSTNASGSRARIGVHLN